MIEIELSSQISYMLTIHRMNTLSCLYKIRKKFEKLSISNLFVFRGTKCRSKANNNREAVVVCPRHVVKQPSKRSALVYLYIHIYIYIL